MSRIKGSKNKSKALSKMSPEDRIKVFANLIIDRVLEEKARGKLFKSL